MGKAFVVPFLIYLLGTNAASRFDGTGYAIAYACVVVTVVGYLAYSFSDWKSALAVASTASRTADAKAAGPWQLWKRILVGSIVGVVGIIAWVAICGLQLEQYFFQFLPAWLQPSERVGFDPFKEFADSGTLILWGFIVVRMLGLAAVVPLMEELFWRGFLIRWFIDSDWEKVPIGTYSFTSSALVTLLFALAHPELVAAAVYCVLINALLFWTRDLLQCVAAHAASNLCLGIYVLSTATWELW